MPIIQKIILIFLITDVVTQWAIPWKFYKKLPQWWRWWLPGSGIIGYIKWNLSFNSKDDSS